MASGMDVANRAQAEMREIGGQCGNNNKYTHWYSDNVDNYIRAGEVMTVDGVRYVIESTDHSIVDGWHFDKLELRKII